MFKFIKKLIVKKKNIWFLIAVIIIGFIAIPTFHILSTKWNEEDTSYTIPKGFTDDASQLNLTKVDMIIEVPNDKKEIENQLKSILKYAKENQLKISIAGAKHSMGGHTIYPNGIDLNMLPYKQMEFDKSVQSQFYVEFCYRFHLHQWVFKRKGKSRFWD